MLAVRTLHLLYALPIASIVVSAYHAGKTESLRSATSLGNPPHSKELFSVAPMMGHTNRHYRYFFRLLSRRAHLYTEMIPSSQIVRAYRRARGIYLHVGTDRRNQYKTEEINAEEMMEVVARMKANPGKEYQSHESHGRDDILTLHQLIGTSSSIGSSDAPRASEYPVVLQLGGKDATALGMAAAIGAAYGHGEYHEINLNCGCPSNAVGGRSGGCALMRQHELVAQCVEQMNAGVHSLADAQGSSTDHIPDITVKHRLGVRDASTFDPVADRAKNDEEAYAECSNFIRTVSLHGDVTKFHVHARLGLLGEFAGDGCGDNHRQKKMQQSLWVPGDDKSNNLPIARIGKIDHKREREKAQRRARKATVKNRHVPPLRPKVINSLAAEFTQYEFVTNGGIQTMSEVNKIVNSGLHGDKQTSVVGAMVGRTAINHPCSFTSADALWDSDIIETRPTRGEILEVFSRYCDEEEERIQSYGASHATMENLRRRLVAVPFHLFVGEEGSDEFQRHLKKLREKCRSVKASSIIAGSASFIPTESLNKYIDDFVAWEDLVLFDKGLQRGSAMQRVVY